jgi:hypothetical protein
LKQTTHNRVTDHEKLVPKHITIPVAFKAITYSRRAQLRKRQASIVKDLRILAFWVVLPSGLSLVFLIVPAGL